MKKRKRKKKKFKYGRDPRIGASRTIQVVVPSVPFLMSHHTSSCMPGEQDNDENA